MRFLADLALFVEVANTGNFRRAENVVCPGFVATDLNDFRGQHTVEQGAKQAVKMALIGPDGPSGTFTDEDGTVRW